MIFVLAIFAVLLFGATVFSYSGLAITTNLVSGLGGTVPKYIGWGTGAGTSARADTDLFTPASTARAAGTVTRTTTSQASDTVQVVGTLTAGGALAISNAGLFDAAGTGLPPTGGNLFVKADSGVLNLATGDGVQYTFTLQYS
jgi:hypothetical protein